MTLKQHVLGQEVKRMRMVIDGLHILQRHLMIQKLLNQFNQDDDYSVLLAEIMLISATKNTITDQHLKKAIHQLLRKEHHDEQL